MRRKVKRTLKIRTTETWTITWHTDGRAARPVGRPRRRPRKKLPPGEKAEGETEQVNPTSSTQPSPKP